MSATIIDGKQISEDLKNELKQRVDALVAAGHPRPGLATVLVGEDPASARYVASKQRTCEALGIESFGHVLDAETSESDLLSLIDELNANPAVHGILVQLPLPKQIDERQILLAIAGDKDVDGFHPRALGDLAQRGGKPPFVACTPAGVMRMLATSGVELSGAEAVVVGRSNIVGMPMALLLIEANATVTVCHSRTKDLTEHLQRADVVIAAAGRPRMIKGEMLKPGATVIDVGTNVIEDASRKSGKRLVGDVDFDSAVEIAGAISPVPGGVGPMTIAMLMHNTVVAAERRAGA